jgi:hypothetical protein
VARTALSLIAKNSAPERFTIQAYASGRKMAPKPRPLRLQVKLTDEEHEQLSAQAAALGKTRSAFVRDALRKAAEHETTVPSTVTRTDALGLLASAVEEGSVTAMVALERALRLQPVEAPVHRRRGRVTVADLTPDELQAGLRLVR